MARWLNCGVTTQVPWPKTEKAVKYGENTFILRPRTKTTSASVHIRVEKIGDVAGLTAINRFLSALSWKCDQPSINHYGWSGNPIPVSVPIYQIPLGICSTDNFPDEVKEIKDEKARLAISLYSEGLSPVANVPFRFLSFFKVLNVFWNDKTTKGVNPLKEAIRAELPNLTDREAKARIAQIAKDHGDVADYLYRSGRCAVAHAFQDPIVDPDDVADLRQLSENEWLIRQLAIHMIQKMTGAEQSIWS